MQQQCFALICLSMTNNMRVQNIFTRHISVNLSHMLIPHILLHFEAHDYMVVIQSSYVRGKLQFQFSEQIYGGFEVISC